MTTSMYFKVPGRLAGKGRPRATVIGGKARMYTPAATASAEDRVREAWRAEGCPYLGEGALSIEVRLYEQRPAGHFTSKGALSAAGKRKLYPAHKPDLDNVLKLVGDALNGCAWRDDSQFVSARILRQWAVRDEAVVSAAVLGEIA